jgi:acyl-CoA synthetase (AMP-forming)/AMP-acid ligase II
VSTKTQKFKGSLEMSTLLSLILKPASLTSATAIVLPGNPYPQSHAKKAQDEQEEYSYSDFRALVLLFRKVLIEQLGVKPSEVIALSMTNTVEFMIAFVGTTVSRLVFIKSSYARQN